MYCDVDWGTVTPDDPRVRGGEEDLGTELHSQEFPISKFAVNENAVAGAGGPTPTS